MYSASDRLLPKEQDRTFAELSKLDELVTITHSSTGTTMFVGSIYIVF